ncbi:adhesion G-protein coupled receptor D1 isoform X1 [Polypterus senegalus]|uniref:adhesion G-protein coupled receptor D1 isoform X1 n=1 Tax=Polypterus senegalus TaxID=55291 RepID=UPI00196275A4|nr:adhesion G-protein coupled receptor D1 isoform X1 [Polypterus senegalus]
MEKPGRFLSLTAVLALIRTRFQVHCINSPSLDHPGFNVFVSASHYWPLDFQDGSKEQLHTIGNRTALVNGKNISLRIHNYTVLSSHNSTSVYANDSAYTNLSATVVDIVAEIISQGIYVNSDDGEKFLHFGNSKNSCISDLAFCSPEGVTFSFFWKKQESPSTSKQPSVGKIISSSFSVCIGGPDGDVEFFTHQKTHIWRAQFSPSDSYWTNILFTWTQNGGLKVFINATSTANDTTGKVSENYMNSCANQANQEDNSHYYGHFVTGSFDEFIIWERALTPEEIELYYKAATGIPVTIATSSSFANSTSAPLDLLMSTDAYHPIITNLTVEIQNFRYHEPVVGFLESVSVKLPNKTIPLETASNLTEIFLNSVDEVLSLPSWTDVPESYMVVSGLIETVDKVMVHMVINLEEKQSTVISIEGTTSVADYSLMKLPQTVNPSNYRFPAQGKNYISVPAEAFNLKYQTTIVGLFYHKMHRCYQKINPLSTNIKEAAAFKDYRITATSYIISLKVDPPPALSVNLSGNPLIKIVLIHVLNGEQYSLASNQSNRVFLYCAYLNYSSGSGVWSNEGCVRTGGNLSFSICLCNHLTNFAILMQVVPLELAQVHQEALSLISYVGCSISIFCLGITLVTFAILSSVSTIRNQRYHIHANLAFAILVAQILLLISFQFFPRTLPCKIMAVLLHFFFLSAFAWMLVEGLHLYSMVIKVFGSEESKHIYYYGVGWGAPLVICIVSITSSLHSYGDVGNCWLSLKTGAIWAFVAPALFVIVVNIGILIAVTRIISRISADNYKVHGDANAVKLTTKAVAVLLPILGISWIFGVLAVNEQVLAFQYMFAVFNSLQGFFIFLFHCLLNSEVRAAFKHKTKVWSLTSSSIRNVNVKPFNSDVMNGNRPGATPTKMNTWDKSTNSANRIDLSAV